MAQTSDLFNFYLLFLFHKYPKTKMWTTIKENVWIWFPTKSASGIFFQIFQKFRKINKSFYCCIQKLRARAAHANYVTTPMNIAHNFTKTTHTSFLPFIWLFSPEHHERASLRRTAIFCSLTGKFCEMLLLMFF